MPRKGQHMIFLRARDRQRLVGSLLEEVSVPTAEIQRLIGDIELDSPISAPCDQFADQRGEVLRLPLLKFIELRHTGAKIHRTAIIGINKAKVPKLGPLIKVGHTWRSDLEKGL